MTILTEHQFELLPSEDATEGEVFGLGRDVHVEAQGFIPGSTSWTSQTQPNQQRGGMRFGRDVLNGPLWAWECFIHREDTEGALESLNRFSTAWRASHIRRTPGAMVPLRYHIGGRTRRIYGRPQANDATPDNRILNGMVPFGIDFQAVDGYTYADEMDVMTLGHRQVSEGGFVFPVTFPIDTLPPGRDAGQAVVTGDADTYPIVRFNGAVTDPILVHNDWALRLNMSIPLNQYVEIDLRPWKLDALLNGTTSVAGQLGRRQALADIKFSPGRHDLAFEGSSSGSSAGCEVRWAPAYNSL